MKTFGIGRDKVELWCTESSTLPNGGKKMFVINGAWYFHIPPEGSFYYMFYGATCTLEGYKILWDRPLPDKISKDYNVAIGYMNEHLHDWKIKVLLVDTWCRIKLFHKTSVYNLKRLKLSCSEAKRKFLVEWNSERITALPASWDDDIAF